MINDAKVDELAGQLEELDLEHAMHYTLADAIREGSTVTEHCIGAWDRGGGTELCALSAAMLALKARRMV